MNLEIYVGVSRAKSKEAFMSKLLQLYMRTEYSHIFFKIYDKELDVWYIYEATGHGVHQRNKKFFDQANLTVKQYRLPDLELYQSERLFKKDLILNSGIHYSVAQNIGILINDVIYKLTGNKMTKNLFPRGANCSELVAVILQSYWGIAFKEEMNLLDPKEVIETVKEWLKLKSAI